MLITPCQNARLQASLRRNSKTKRFRPDARLKSKTTKTGCMRMHQEDFTGSSTSDWRHREINNISCNATTERSKDLQCLHDISSTKQHRGLQQEQEQRKLGNGNSHLIDGNMNQASPRSYPSMIQTSLKQLWIKDFALVAEEIIHFEPGLNVITGESGSGKSVLVEALGLIIGVSASHDCIRAPAKCAVIEGTYALDPEVSTAVKELLCECGLPARALPESDKACDLVIKREIIQTSSEGGRETATSTRSRCYVNGAATSLRVLREIGNLLVDANAQDSAQALRVAGTTDLANSVTQLESEARQLEDKLSALDDLEDEDERNRMQALCDVVNRMRVEANEEMRLRQAIKNNDSKRGAVEQCAAIRNAVVGEPGSGGGLIAAVKSLEVQLGLIMKQEQQMAAAEQALRSSQNNSTSDDEESGDLEDEDEEEDQDQGRGKPSPSRTAKTALEALSLARSHLSDAESHIKIYSRSIHFDAAEHHSISERLKALEKLIRANNCRSTAQLLQKSKEADEQLQAFYEAEEHQAEWQEQLDKVENQLRSKVVDLSQCRHSAAARLGSSVEACLRELAMGGSRFDVQISLRSTSKELSVSQGVFLPTSISRLLSDHKPNISDGNTTNTNTNKSKISNSSGLTSNSGSSQASTPSLELKSKEGKQNLSAAFDNDSSSFPSIHPPSPDGSWILFSPDSGIDHVEFLLSAGPNEPMRSLAAVASGGESARVMLALKAAPCLAAAQAVVSSVEEGEQKEELEAAKTVSKNLGSPVLILDELDSSIGARLGSTVGRILRRMCCSSRPANAQIICVTHLPQVACFANRHLRVKKHHDIDGRVVTMFELLGSEEKRVEEVAAMLGGSLESDVALEMLRSAQERFLE